MSRVFQLKPKEHEVFGCIKTAVDLIQPRQHIEILLPRSFSHYLHEGRNWYNWDNLEEVQMNVRGSIVPDTVFVTLRFDQNDEKDDVIVDIIRFG